MKKLSRLPLILLASILVAATFAHPAAAGAAERSATSVAEPAKNESRKVCKKKNRKRRCGRHRNPGTPATPPSNVSPPPVPTTTPPPGPTVGETPPEPVEEPLPEGTGPCGGVTIPKASGGQWQCTFADEFGGTSLDRAKWTVMTTALSGFTHAGECFVDDPSTVSVGGGHLTLTSRKLTQPTSCGGLYDARYLSGMVFTRDFAQARGRFEARLRFPEGSGLASSWWMWPKEMAYGVKSGEIDIAEHFGAYPDIVSPFVHMLDEEPRDHGKGAYCNIADPGGRFHTYAVEWLPGEMRFLFDGVTCMTFSNWDAPSPLTGSQPFDQPFFLVLTLAHGWGENAVSADTPFPADFVIDYVRAWE